MEVDSSREGSLFSVEYGHGSQNQEETAHSHGRGPAGPAVVSRCLEETHRALADFERGLRDQVCDDGEGGIWGSPWAAAESDAEGLVRRIAETMRAFLLQSGAPEYVWDEAADHGMEALNHLGVGGKDPPLLAELKEADPENAQARFDAEDIMKWPPWGCSSRWLMAMLPTCRC